MIGKSFKMCSISNAIDGTEDDYIYQDDIGESEDPFLTLMRVVMHLLMLMMSRSV